MEQNNYSKKQTKRLQLSEDMSGSTCDLGRQKDD